MVSRSITSSTDVKLREKILDEKGITLKLVMDRIRHDAHDRTHGEKFIPNKNTKK